MRNKTLSDSFLKEKQSLGKSSLDLGVRLFFGNVR